MSDNNPVAVRVYALQEAGKCGGNAADILTVAETFLAFLNGGADVKGQPTPAATPEPVKPAKTEKAKPVKATAPVKAEPTAEEIFEDRKVKIGEKVAAALAANKREEAVQIMGSYGTKSVTQLAQGTADLAEILAKFDDILMAA